VAGVALARPQSPHPTAASPLVSVAGSLVVSAVVGLLVVGIVPEYARSIVERVRRRPGESVLYGLAAYVATFVAIVALAITIVGIVVAVPGAFAFAVVVAVGGVLGWTALAAVIVGSDRSLVGPVLAGAAVAAVVGLVPVLGGFVNAVVSAAGVGAMTARYLSSR
jgi:hypothetical protein